MKQGPGNVSAPPHSFWPSHQDVGWTAPVKPAVQLQPQPQKAASSFERPAAPQSKAELIALIRQREGQLAQLVPEVQRLRADYAAQHSTFLRRTEELEAKLLTCSLVAKAKPGKKGAARPSHLANEQDLQEEEKARAKQEKEDAEVARDERDQAEADLAERFLADLGSVLPDSKQKRPRISAAASPTPSLDHAHHTHEKANQWDPTIPPGGRVVDVRVWYGEPPEKPSWEAYNSVRQTCILAPQAKDEQTRLRFLKAEADMEDESKGPPKVPMAEARIIDTDIMLKTLPQSRNGPLFQLGGMQNTHALIRPPRQVCGHDLYFTPLRDGYIAAMGRPERKAWYQAPSDFFEARHHPSYQGLTEFLEPDQRYQVAIGAPGLRR
eukprot:TRINITY_DN123173_c0_g1_i1.p1 TRINITY_DN123173_c0_g1~~TRINITY_DN123173_c0_g1_i1.p1  ORF type:complete len:381 (-),score=103.76 TRINITY_DN123173_c0_g1_i1:94-1236(-)